MLQFRGTLQDIECRGNDKILEFQCPFLYLSPSVPIREVSRDFLIRTTRIWHHSVLNIRIASKTFLVEWNHQLTANSSE
jgi:hypothetical protein